MAKKRDPKDIISLEEEVMFVLTIEHEALINILEKKGLIEKKEFLKEIKRLKKEYAK